MAKVYISYQHQDRSIVDQLVPLLQKKGHTTWFDHELFIGAIWREQLEGALLTSDVVLVLWSKHTPASDFVPAEIGAARVKRDIGIMPIIVDGLRIPTFIGDITAGFLPNRSATEINKLANQIDVSIKKHVEQRLFRRAGKPKIFISHRHKDEALVRRLLACLETYLDVVPEDIRCTSVEPYRLRAGEDTPDRLRVEIADAEVVLGVLTTDTLQSNYVAFELGAAWGRRIWTCPLLACGANPSHIPDPIRGLSPLVLSRRAHCEQLLRDLARFTSLNKRAKMNKAVLKEKVDKLVAAAKTRVLEAQPAAESLDQEFQPRAPTVN